MLAEMKRLLNANPMSAVGKDFPKLTNRQTNGHSMLVPLRRHVDDFPFDEFHATIVEEARVGNDVIFVASETMRFWLFKQRHNDGPSSHSITNNDQKFRPIFTPDALPAAQYCRHAWR